MARYCPVVDIRTGRLTRRLCREGEVCCAFNLISNWPICCPMMSPPTIHGWTPWLGTLPTSTTPKVIDTKDAANRLVHGIGAGSVIGFISIMVVAIIIYWRCCHKRRARTNRMNQHLRAAYTQSASTQCVDGNPVHAVIDFDHLPSNRQEYNQFPTAHDEPPPSYAESQRRPVQLPNYTASIEHYNHCLPPSYEPTTAPFGENS